MSDRYEQVTVRSRAELHGWLAAHHADTPGIWLVTFKQGAGRPHVTYDEIVEEALIFGWVDSRSRGLDGERSQLLLTPRKPASGWSRTNKARIARLTAAGLMEPSGLAMVELAQRTGTWTKLDDIENLVEPPALAAALDADEAARRHWDAFPRSAKRAILEWIATAKRPETRDRRIAETATLAAENIRANQWRQPASGSQPVVRPPAPGTGS